MKWLKRLTDECHEHGAAVMIQLTHLGRRTTWNRGDWLPVLAPSPIREPAHRSFPKEMEDWDIERVIRDFASAAQRMQEAGLDGIEFEATAIFSINSGRPPPIPAMTNSAARSTTASGFRFACWQPCVEAVGDLSFRRLPPRRRRGLGQGASSKEEGLEICRRLIATGHVDFLNVDPRPRRTATTPLSRGDPDHRHGVGAAPGLCRRVRKATRFPVFHAARITDVPPPATPSPKASSTWWA